MALYLHMVDEPVVIQLLVYDDVLHILEIAKGHLVQIYIYTGDIHLFHL